MICFANVAIFIDMEVELLIKIDGEGKIGSILMNRLMNSEQ